MIGKPMISNCPDCGQSFSEHSVYRCAPASSCNWTEDADTGSYDTACGNKHTFIDGTPADNGYRFCPYCGGALEESHD